MSYQLPQINVRIFTGVANDVVVDGSNDNTSVNAGSEHNKTCNVDQAIDIAFVNKVKSLVLGSKAQLESMKTNVSPVLRWVVLMHDREKETSQTLEKSKSAVHTKELSNTSTHHEREQRSTEATATATLSALLSDTKALQQSQEADTQGKETQQIQKQMLTSVSSTTTSETTNVNPVLNALSRRGVGFKDPLMERLKKRMLKEKRSQENICAQESDRNKSADDTLNVHTKPVHTTSHEVVSILPSIAPTHWTQRRLSEMQNSSWAIFREQVGILVEVYNRRHQAHESNFSATFPANMAHIHSIHTQRQQVESDEGEQHYSNEERQAAMTTAAETKSLALPRLTLDTIHPIRCWEEARLPYALGKCVSSSYGFPTAVQCMCVPLANAVLQTETSIGNNNKASSYTDASVDAVTARQKAENSYIHKIDVLAVAETGSGKTAAYMVPILTDILLHRPKLLNDPERISLGPFSLVLVPTRELAEQVTREFHKLLHLSSTAHKASHKRNRQEHHHHKQQNDEEDEKNVLRLWEKEEMDVLATREEKQSYASSHNLLSEIRVVKVTGGESTLNQFAQLSEGAHVVIGTVGQLSALLQERLLSLGNTQMVVIDEADRMIDDDQTNSLRNSLIEVLDRCPTPRQTLLFTATLSAECTGIAKRYLSSSGYYIIRTPQRCASIVQNFEVVPCTPLEWVASETRININNNNNKNVSNLPMQERARVLHRLIHPTKFNRLVSWLAYCPLAPIVIFANEKKICDALQEELRNERAHLHELEQEFDLYTLLGPSPWLTQVKHVSNSANNTNESVVDEMDVLMTRKQAITLDNLSSVAVIHSELSQNERQRLVQLLHRGERKVLITTDLLARGLDLPHVSLVINYDLPWGNRALNKKSNTASNDHNGEIALTQYIHRVGRTGRAGEKGTTVSFLCLPNDLVQRAMRVWNKMTQNDITNNSSYNTNNKTERQGQAEWRDKNDALRRGVVAPGTTVEAQLDALEKMELTQPKHRLYGSSSLEDWNEENDDDFNNNGDEEEEESSEEEEESYDETEDRDEGHTDNIRNGQNSENNANERNGVSNERKRNGRAQHVSVVNSSNNNNNNSNASMHKSEKESSHEVETITFASDEAILTPLWNFLCECATSNGCSNAEDALRTNCYPLIHLPPALTLLMIKLSNSSSPYGTITK